MIKAIITDREFLSIPCEEVKEGEDIIQIIEDLTDTLATKAGYALAANQIGYNKAIAVISMKKEDFDVILVNPKIIDKDERILFRKEGCLSFPGVFIDTDRYNQITYQTGIGDRVQMFAIYGLPAIVVQHEIDHLRGILFFNKKHKARR